MRTLSSTQQDVLKASAYSVFTRMRVANASGTLVDLSTYGGREWFAGGEMSVTLDEIVPAAQLYVARSNSTAPSGSLAPLIEASTLNVNDAGSYAALLDAGAEVYWDVATLPQGSTQPATGSTQWTTLFHGEIDTVAFGGPEIEIYARDKIGALIADRWVEAERQYGTESGTAIESVMQDITNEWADGQAVQVPSSPGFLVTTYIQSQQSVLDALRTLAQLPGWDVRPQWYNTSSGFALVFQEPDRAASTSVWTFGSTGYIDVRRLGISRENVRNVVSVGYTLSSTGGSTSAQARQYYEASDSTSITRFGRRWMQIDLADDSDIDTSTEAQALGDAVLSDLSTPDAEQEIETFFFWPVMLGDYLTFTANDVHYDVDQNWAVSGYRHVLRNNQHRTFVQVRGKPAGQYMNWFRREVQRRDAVDLTYAKSLLNFRDSQNSTADTVTFSWDPGDLVDQVWVYDRLYSQPEPSNPWPQDGDSPTSVLTRGTNTYTASLPVAGKMRTIQFEPRTTSYEAGPVKRVRLFPRVLTSVRSTDITDGAIVASKLIASAQTFGSDVVFSSTDDDTVSWSAGTITFASSTQYSINAGNTGNMASTALRYVYFDTNQSVTTLQISTNSTDTAGDGRTLLAVVAKAPSTNQTAFYVPAVGVLGLNGDHISPSSVTTDKVAANAITAAKINVASLSAISADLGTVTAGTVDAAVIIASSQFTANLARFKGVEIGSSTGYGTGKLTIHDLVRFRTAGAIQIEDGRRVEFSDSSVDANVASLDYAAGGKLNIIGELQYSTQTAVSASTAFAASHYFTLEDRGGNVMYVPCTTAAW